MQSEVDTLAAHRVALADYEAEAAALEAMGADTTAAMFRKQAERRRALIEKLENAQHEQSKTQNDDSSK